MQKSRTFRIELDAPIHLRALAKALGIIAEKGYGAETQQGSASSLLDHIAMLVQAEGADAIARRLKGDG